MKITPLRSFYIIFLIVYSMNMSADISKFLPNAVNQWINNDPDQIYNQTNLYDYIDGGAELYISYHFKTAISRQFQKAEQPSISIEIFDMQLAKNAYGVFSISKEKNDSLFGQGSQYIEGSVIFWKNNYFVSIMADYETPATKETMFAMAHYIDDAITTKGEKPDIINLLPEKGLDVNSIIYFNHYAWQNTYYYLIDGNAFNLTNTSNAVLARYNVKNSSVNILLIEYNSREDADEGYQSFVNKFYHSIPVTDIQQLEDTKWFSCNKNGKYIVCYFNAKKDSTIQHISQLFNHSLK